MAPPTGQVLTNENARARAKNQTSYSHDRDMTELDNKIKVLKLKITKTEEIIPKRDQQALERLRLSISSLVSARKGNRQIRERRRNRAIG